MGAWLTGMILRAFLFALAYHFGMLDSIIATWTPVSQSAHIQLEWN